MIGGECKIVASEATLYEGGHSTPASGRSLDGHGLAGKHIATTSYQDAEPRFLNKAAAKMKNGGTKKSEALRNLYVGNLESN